MQAFGKLGWAGLMLISAGCSLFSESEKDRPVCGNGVVESGEECDEGPATGIYGVCQEGCLNPSTRCGDIQLHRSGQIMAEHLTISGQLAYEAAGNSGMRILDMSNPMKPAVLGWLATDGHTSRIIVEGGLTYIHDGPNGIIIADASDPRRPKTVGHFPTESPYFRFALQAGHLYLAEPQKGLTVLDVSNPANPVQVGEVQGGSVFGELWVGHGVMLVAGRSDGLWVYDLSNPAQPALVAQHTDPAWGRAEPYRFWAEDEDLLVVGFSYYWSDGEGRNGNHSSARLIRLSALPDIVEAGVLDFAPSFNGDSGLSDLVMDGPVAYAEAGDSTIEILDLRDPAKPLSLGRLDSPRFGLALQGGLLQSGKELAWVRPRFPGWEVVDLSDPSQITISQSKLENVPSGASSSKGWTYLTSFTEERQVEIRAVGWPGGPAALGLSMLNGDSKPFVAEATSWGPLDGPLHYRLEYEQGVRILDFADPMQPREAAWIPEEGASFRDIGLSGNLMLLMAYEHTEAAIRVYDVTNPYIPAQVARITKENCQGCAVRNFTVLGDHIYLLDYDQLFIISLSNPGNPSLASVVRLDTYANFLLEDGLGHLVVRFNETFDIYSIEDPLYPRLLRTVERSDYPPIYARQGNFGYRAEENTLVIEDISDPDDPQPVQRIPIKGILGHGSPSLHMLYVGIKGAGLAALTGLPGLCDP